MKQITYFLCIFFLYPFNSFSQIVKEDTLWIEDFEDNEYSGNIFPDLFIQIVNGSGGKSVEYYPLSITGDYAFRMKLNYNGNIQYDSIKIIGSIDFPRIENEKARYSNSITTSKYNLGVNQYSYESSKPNIPWSFDAPSSLVCKGCSTFSFNGKVTGHFSASYAKAFVGSFSQTTPSSSLKSSQYHPIGWISGNYNLTDYPGEYLLSDFCNYCAILRDFDTRDEAIYEDCKNNAYIPVTGSMSFYPRFTSIYVVGYKTEIINAFRDEVNIESPIVKKIFDLQGKELTDCKDENQLVIVSYSNGIRKLEKCAGK